MTNSDTKKISNVYAMPKLSFKAQTVATIVAVASAILLPQLLHMLGAGLGLGNSLGELFLPMHLPVLMVGLLAGAYPGFVTGLISPIISYFLTGMPGVAMLPFMVVELAVYGFACGIMRNLKINTIFKVVIAQFAGRFVRSMVILFAVYVLGNTMVGPAVIWTSFTKGFGGIIIQWITIPLVVYLVRKADKDGRDA